MSFIFRNAQTNAIKVYIQPSTDEIKLSCGDELMVTPKLEPYLTFEFEVKSDSLVVWIPTGQSATLFVNGEKIESFCEQYIW